MGPSSSSPSSPPHSSSRLSWIKRWTSKKTSDALHPKRYMDKMLHQLVPAPSYVVLRSTPLSPSPLPNLILASVRGWAETARWCNILSIAGEIHGAHSRILPILDWGGGGEECSSTHLTTRLKWCNILSMYGTPWPGPGSGPSRRQDEYFQYAVPRGPDPFPRTGFSS